MKYNIFDYDDLPESIQSLAFDELNERFKEYEDSISKDQDEIIEEKKKKDKQEIIFLLIKFILLIISIALAPIIVSSIISFNIAYIVVFTLLCIVGIMIYYLIKARKKPKTIDDYLKINEVKDKNIIRDGFTPQKFHPESFADPNQKPSPYIIPNNYTSEIMVFLQYTDPVFNSIEFIEWSKKCFRIFWDSWTIGNIEASRIFLGDDLYEKMRSLLEDNFEKNRKDIYNISSLVGCFINKYERESGFEYITLYLMSIHRHYVLDSRKNSNIPIEGSFSENLKTIYQLKFMRRFTVDQKTNIQNGIQTVICPNCGAKVTVLNTGHCEFCGSIIKVSEFSWVLSDIDEYHKNSSLVDNRGVIIHNAKF